MDDIKNLCDDDELDDLPGAFNQDICSVCGEFGKDNEIWFRCVMCSRWAHKDCSGWDETDGRDGIDETFVIFV